MKLSRLTRKLDELDQIIHKAPMKKKLSHLASFKQSKHLGMSESNVSPFETPDSRSRKFINAESILPKSQDSFNDRSSSEKPLSPVKPSV